MKQTIVLLREELRELFTRKRSLFSLVSYVGFTLLVFSGLARAMQRARDAVGGHSAMDEPQVLIERFGHSMQPEMYNVLKQLAAVPAPIVIYQCLSLVVLPTLVAMVSCDMVSVDISRGTLRYVLLRASRTAYYLSKLLSHSVLYVIIHLVTMLGLLYVLAESDSAFNAFDHLTVALAYVAITVPAVWFMVALTAWVSSWCRRTISALLLIHLFWIILLSLMVKWPEFTPFYSKITVGLVAPFAEFAPKTLLGMSAWAFGFSVAGFLGFLRRDV